VSREPLSEPVRIHVDGASRGNPGDAGYGVSVAGPNGQGVAALYGYLGRTTNNVAEYQALLHGLQYALAKGMRRVEVFSDSELMVKQLHGAYRVRQPHLVPLHRLAKELLARFESAAVTHVFRNQNREADRLANRAVDERGTNWPEDLPRPFAAQAQPT
jgi:ribonuclease HI